MHRDSPKAGRVRSLESTRTCPAEQSIVLVASGIRHLLRPSTSAQHLTRRIFFKSISYLMSPDFFGSSSIEASRASEQLASPAFALGATCGTRSVQVTTEAE